MKVHLRSYAHALLTPKTSVNAMNKDLSILFFIFMIFLSCIYVLLYDILVYAFSICLFFATIAAAIAAKRSIIHGSPTGTGVLGSL